MILAEVQLKNRSNEHCEQQGLDTLDRSPDPDWFRSFPDHIDYRYNSRGFRDTEWPTDLDQLQNSIWCMGDSFTVGIGSAFDHTWPQVLQAKTATRCINVSMDGASNNWIARQAVKILQEVQPRIMVIHWSYLHRREGLTKLNSEAKYRFIMHYQNIKDPSWPSLNELDQFSNLPVHIQNEILNQHNNLWRQDITDDQLRLWHIRSDVEEDIDNTYQCVNLVDQHSGSTQVVHSFIPGFVQGYQPQFFERLQTAHAVIPEFARLDLARDKHHYDIKTCDFFVQQILQVLNWPDSI